MTKHNDGIPTLADGVPHIGQEHPSLGDILGAAMRHTTQSEKTASAIQSEPERKYPQLPAYLMSTVPGIHTPTNADMFVELCERRLSWNKERARQFLDVLIMAVQHPDAPLATQLPGLDQEDLADVLAIATEEGNVAAVRRIRDLFRCELVQANAYFHLVISPILDSRS